jgi:hypothetical protein
MEKNVQSWSVVTKGIYTAVLLFSIASIFVGLFEPLGNLWSTGSNIVSFASGGSLSSGPNFFEILNWVFLVAVAAGYLLYVLGLGKLGTILKEQDSKAIGQVRIGAIILIAASVCAIFLPSIVIWIAELIGYILMFMGFNVLTKSTAIDALAVKGFGKLKTAVLLILIAVGVSLILGWMPLLGIAVKFIVWVLEIIAFIMVILGWKTVKTAPAK